MRKRADLLDYVSKKCHKTVSVWTVGRILKEADFVWKRMRKSCKPRRDEVLFAFFKEELRLLKQMEDNNEIELFFFDEAGFRCNRPAHVRIHLLDINCSSKDLI